MNSINSTNSTHSVFQTLHYELRAQETLALCNHNHRTYFVEQRTL